MNIKFLVTPETVRTTLPGKTKDEILNSLLDILYVTGKVKDRDEALKSIREREQKMSTGLKNGIAVPHGKTDAVDGLLVAIAVRKEGIDFDSLDGKPSTIFIMTLSPKNQSGPHLQFLAEVSKLLENVKARDALLAVKSPEEIVKVFTAIR